MDTLKELALIITRNKAKSIEVLDTQKREESKINDFYYQLTEGSFTSDEEAAAYFYPGQKGGSNYRKLKAGLKSRMLNSLFFLDVKKSTYTDRQSAYYECYKDWATINILLAKNAYTSCKELSKKVLRYADKYEFTELTRDVSRVLRLHYGAQMGDVKQYKHYREVYETYDQICRWEDIAERHYTDIMIEYVNSKSSKDHLLLFVEDALLELESYIKESDSYRLNLYYFLIKLVKQSMVNDFQAVYLAGQEMASFFEAKNYTAATPLQIAYYYQLLACTQLGQYPEGKKIALKCLELQSEGSFNWFKYHELYFLLAMHSGEYQEALSIYNKVVDNSRMKFLPDNVKEIWTIFWAYLYYLGSIGELDITGTDNVFSKFRLGRFINETPIFSKDKRGMNIAILIIQVLFLIEQNKYNVAIDKLESLDKYCARYLHKEETLRSYYFLKMLLSFPKGAFHRVAVERKASSFIDKLKNIPLENANQTYKIEILPYEKLWEFAIDMLNLKGYNTRNSVAK
ncbi:MAG: hypothetical protein ACRBG0_15450 [Lewinella sp.]|uniref:hypothetical protein n=1 Tax=Lewinella sp. TaxID=2004506 RepID=UPI003D6B4555